MDMHSEPGSQAFVSMWLLPMMSTSFYLAFIVFFIYLAVRLLKFMKRTEERDKQIIRKLDDIIKKLDN